MFKYTLHTITALTLLTLLHTQAQTRSRTRQQQGSDTYRIETTTRNIQARNFAPLRKDPVFKGPFSVGIVLIRFPDTRTYDLEDITMRLSRFGHMTIENYFKEYSQGITWPELVIIGSDKFPDAVYEAPEPLGYYCRHDTWNNPIGYHNDGDGRARAAKLKQDARNHAFRLYKRGTTHATRPDGSPHVVAYAYEVKLRSKDELKPIIRHRYPKGMMISYDRTREAWELYGPEIRWADPLWPDSSVQIHNSGDGGTLCHELGHVLGAPDFYHATEPHDGVGGNPCLSWDFGPTGPGYCRVIYQAFLPPTAYPMLTQEGTYTLHPRNTNPAEDKSLGAFIPSAHPNYLFCLEYVKREDSPLGQSNESGLLIQVINVTLPGPFKGPPDLCYAYRPDDPWLQGHGITQQALFGEDTGRFNFNMESNPKSILPNLLDSGIAIEEITENTDNTITFKLRHTTPPITGTALRESLLPKINLDEITEILPNSALAKATVTYRGEPLKTEYGFCWETMARPTVKPGKHYPLYHRDRYSGRILGLRPNTTYFFRAYIRSDRGINYSDQELTIKTPPANTIPEALEPLLNDTFAGNWTIDRFHSGQRNGEHVVGSCAMTAMLKLITYYRSPLDPTIRTAPFDLSRIHTRPSLTRPDFRMTEFHKAVGMAKGLSEKAKLTEKTFPKDFNRHIARTFGLRPQRGNAPEFLTLTKENIAEMEPLIKAQLAQGKPLVVIQESLQPMTPTNYALMTILIDGYTPHNDFHIVYPAGRDRDTNLKSGWLPLETLLNKTNEVRLLFNLAPF